MVDKIEKEWLNMSQILFPARNYEYAYGLEAKSNAVPAPGQTAEHVEVDGAPVTQPATQSASLAAAFNAASGVPAAVSATAPRTRHLTPGELNAPFRDGKIEGFDTKAALGPLFGELRNGHFHGETNFEKFSDLFHVKFESLLMAHAMVNFQNHDTVEFKTNILGDVLVYFASTFAASADNRITHEGKGSEILLLEREMFAFIKEFAQEFAKENDLLCPVEAVKEHMPQWFFDDKMRVVSRGAYMYGLSLVPHMRNSADSTWGAGVEGMWAIASVLVSGGIRSDADAEEMLNTRLQMMEDGTCTHPSTVRLAAAFRELENAESGTETPGDGVEPPKDEDENEIYVEEEAIDISQLLRSRFIDSVMAKIKEALLNLGGQPANNSAQQVAATYEQMLSQSVLPQ